MKKNDKVIVALGIAVLVVASIGVYYWSPVEPVEEVEIKDFIGISGVFSTIPTAITVPMDSPFFALIATPVAVHYNAECEQQVIPLLVKNLSKPSRSLERVAGQLGVYDGKTIDNSKSPKQVSLDIAMEYWERSKAALLLENNQSGYELGVIATPLASYLSIPVIVTDKLDQEVIRVLNDLGVTHTIVCGSRIGGHGKVLRFDKVEEIVNASIELVTTTFREKNPKFEIDYITLTNPIDAWPPKVLDSEEFYFGPEPVKSVSMNREGALKFMIDFFTKKVTWKFTIPDDYKYALIEIDGYNHELEGVDEFGDSAEFSIDPVDKGLTLGSVSTAHGIPNRDGKGNIIEDRVHTERVLYDCGGKSYTLSAGGSWTLKDEGKVSAHVTIKKLEHPIYPMMKKLSTMAPYLTAYHKGIIFGKPEFAFTANDDVITEDGKTCPGFYLPGRNPLLVPMSNKHIYDNIHKPLNKLLAKLADISYDKPSDLKPLTEYYKSDPVYIALVGGATVLPRYLYQNEVEPIGDIDGDGIDDTVALDFGGGGTQSDNIYGNIDPVQYDWSNQAQDIYGSKHPFLENIVGRITGWDVQDAAALIVRTIFYDDIIEELTEWKDNFGNLNGGGTDFRKPLWVQILNHIPGLKQVLNLVNQMSGGLVNFAVGPWKYDTGFGKIMAQAIENEIGKDLDFDVETALSSAAMIDGLSDEALDQIKTTNLWNRLTFSESQVKEIAGKGNVKGREILENSNFLWVTGHGSTYNFGMDGPDLVSSGFDGIILNAPRLWQKIWKNIISPYFVVGFWGPGGGLGKVGEYNPRLVSTVDFGPSFMWLESCFCGKITGVYPQANIGQSFIHSGVNTLISSTTGSNIPGGYLEPKNHMYDTKWATNRIYRQWEKKAANGEYPDFHFGIKIYSDLCHILKDDDATIGQAFRDAKNRYLPEDADWELWWSPPLTATSSGGVEGYGPHLAAKYTSFQEYVLYGDPAFNPYMPNE